jgi:ketosteroid isomerase-like protein
MEIVNSPEHAIEILDCAFNEGDLETIMAFYDDRAIVVPQPGVVAKGGAAIREMYSKMLKPGTVARQMKIHVLETDGVALFISQWGLSEPGQREKTFVATTVLRQQDQGGWKVLIDNAQGPAILEL